MTATAPPATDPPAPPGGDAAGAPVDAASQEGSKGVARWVGRHPATTALVLAVVVVGVASGALWAPAGEQGWYDDIAYGTPALVDGQWWTFLTGAFFVPTLLWLYLPILVILTPIAGVYERRVGRWQVVAVVVGGQVLASVVVAAFFSAFRDSGWDWARELAAARDVGISSGLFALVGAFTATMPPVWRLRTRATVSAFLVAMVLNSGHIWDTGHLAGWVLGLAVGPLLAGRRFRRPSVSFGPRTQRAIVALVIAVIAVSVVLEAFWPGNGGPFFSGGQREAEAGAGLVNVIFGVVLLAVADGLRRGRRLAWIVATALTALTVLGWALEDPSAERTADLVLYGAQLALLLGTVRAFGVRVEQRGVRRAGRRLAKVVLGLFLYTAAGFFILQDDFDPPATATDMVAEFATRLVFSTTHQIEPATTAARWFVGSIGAVWLVTLLVTLIGLIYSARRVVSEPTQEQRLRELVQTHESSSIAWMLTWRGNEAWFSADGRTGIGYRVVGSVALALADPVGPAEDRLEALREFDRFCFDHGWVPCFFAAGETTAELAAQVGWTAVQVAEDDIVALPDLAFTGKSWQDVRTALNKAGKQEITLQVTRWAECRPVITDQLHAISEGWVSDKSLPEMGFTLGTLREAADPEVRLHVAVDADGTVEGFTSWMPVARDGQVVGWCLDLMRRRDDGFRPVMEFLIGASAMQFKEEGYEFLSLSAAPLARAGDHPSVQGGDKVVLQRLLDFLGDTLEPYYGFRSLLAFKKKFQPRHEPMYLVYPDETALAEIGIAIARAYMPDATGRDWLRMSADMVPHHDGAAPVSAKG